jgi:twitching motility two-component system response regulator PilH
MLKNHNIEVSVAINGEEGIAKAIAIKPDCILMDVVMPGKNGFQATRDLSRNPATSAIPVIIITTKDQETDKIWGMRQGARDYIVKPAVERDLIERINKVLGVGRDYEA